MGPNVWRRHAVSLLADLATVLGDRGAVVRLLTGLADAAVSHGRVAAWHVAVTRLEAAARKHPSRRRAATSVIYRLRDVFLTGAAADGISRIREVLAAEIDPPAP